MVQILYNNLVKYNADISICDFYISTDSACIKNDNRKEANTLFNRNDLYEIILDNKYVMGFLWNKLLKRDILEKIKYNNKIFEDNIHYSEDKVLLAKYIKHCVYGIYTNNALYYYYQSNFNASNFLNYNDRIHSLIHAYEILLEIYKNNYPLKLNFLKYNYLKINYNMIYRIKLSTNIQNKVFLTNNLKNRIKKYYIELLKENEINFIIKTELVLYYFFPNMIVQTKRVLTKLISIIKYGKK